MAAGNLGKSLETLVNNSARQLGTYQVGINRVLWGNGNTQPKITANYSHQNGSLQYSSSISDTPASPSNGNILTSGLINALNVLNKVNLCNVITYLTSPTNKAKPPRPPKPWSQEQTIFYTLQDECSLVINYIDTYDAHQTTLINSFANLAANLNAPSAPSGSLQPPAGSVTQQQAANQQGGSDVSNPAASAAAKSVGSAGSTDIQGTNVQKYNMFFLIQSISSVFTVSNSTGSLFNSDDIQTLKLIPGIGNSLNILDNFSAGGNQYTNYNLISTADLQKLKKEITLLRTACVTINNLSFSSGVALAGTFLPNDIRNQIQQISKYLDPTQIIPTLKEINSAIQSAILIGRQIQGILKLGQVLIKLILLFNKIYKFVIAFLTKLPLPNQFTTTGITNTFSQATQAAKDESDGLTVTLKAINALLSITVTFIRYLLASMNEVLTRLQTLLATLEGCDAVKDSPVVAQLKQTVGDIQSLQADLGSYIANYDLQTSPTSTTFQGFTINVIPEEVSTAVIYPRRRGIALDKYGEIVVQSDLTFATDTSVIIGEVEQLLVSRGFTKPSSLSADATNQAIINTSLNYLDINDVSQGDLALPVTSLDAPDNLDENSGLGLNAFVNNLKGGRRLRQRTKAALSAASQNLQSQISGENTSARQSVSNSVNSASGSRG